MCPNINLNYHIQGFKKKIETNTNHVLLQLFQIHALISNYYFT